MMWDYALAIIWPPLHAGSHHRWEDYFRDLTIFVMSSAIGMVLHMAYSVYGRQWIEPIGDRLRTVVYVTLISIAHLALLSAVILYSVTRYGKELNGGTPIGMVGGIFTIVSLWLLTHYHYRDPKTRIVQPRPKGMSRWTYRQQRAEEKRRFRGMMKKEKR